MAGIVLTIVLASFFGVKSGLLVIVASMGILGIVLLD